MYKVTNKSEYTVQANLSTDGPVSISPKESLIIRNPSRDFVKEIGRVSNLLSYTEVNGNESGDQDHKDEVVVTEPEHPNSLDKEPGTVIQGTALAKEEINTSTESGESDQYTREELESTHWATIKSIAESNGINYTNKGEAITAILDAKVTK